MATNNNLKPGERFTGRIGRRKPRGSVLWSDDLARWLITICGLASICAVSLVGLFLVWVVLPLFSSTALEEISTNGLPENSNRILFQSLDNYGSLVWSLHADGGMQLRDLENGRVLESQSIRPGRRPTAWAVADQADRLVLGYADGVMVSVIAKYEVSYPGRDKWTEAMVQLITGQRLILGNTLAEKTGVGQIRLTTLTVQKDNPVALGYSPIVIMGVSATSGSLVVTAVDSLGFFHDRKLTWKKNLLTGKLRLKSRGHDLKPSAWRNNSGELPSRMALNDAGDMVLLVHDDGQSTMMRRDEEGRFIAVHELDLLPIPGRKISSLGFLAGQVSVVVGDDKGGIAVWFPVRSGGGGQPEMKPVHNLTHHNSRVTALAASGRSRTLAAGYSDGTIELVHVTSGRFIGQAKANGSAVTSLAISPREDLLVASTAKGLGTWKLRARHPDISVGALLKPVWYEGYDSPQFVWQSSSASDSFEQKLSLIPLIFGTLKATFYSMLFGLPLALLAALYSSEFLHKRTRAKVKPVIEIMASLPSVVLGFLAALVVAPMIEKVVPQTLAVLYLGPFFILLGAQLWQLIPRRWAPMVEPWRPAGILLALAVGGVISWNLGSPVEQVLFEGDLQAWLDGRIGAGVSGWVMLLLPACGLLIGWLNLNFGEGLLRGRGAHWTSLQLGLLDLMRFLTGSLATAALAWFLGWLLSSSGWDPRGTFLGTYVQRNALIVGFAMGFAIIPIIYSIAEDALSAVPDHLRAASLGAGATVWQTTIKVVVPPAVSGLFSAGMIGLGRAVGETMIVLMAAGNTPIMQMNIFNGFRTLSANLAVELPEAVQGSTHYRTLFLAALTLFVMTFILNTIAETVRLHFRRKSSRL